METAAVCQQCHSCDSTLARCWCVDCNEALCDVCVSAHRRVSVTRTHRILNQPPAGDVSTPPTKFCRLHPAEPLKLFCFTCNVLTCRDCQLMNHMNHRYQFATEAMVTIKKQLEACVQPIRAQEEAVRRSLRDMKTRLQDIADSQTNLQKELQNSYKILTQRLTNRMDQLLRGAKKQYNSECEMIQKRKTEMMQLLQSHQFVTAAAEKAKNTNDLSVLQTSRAQIASELKALTNQDVSPPRFMSELKVVTDENSLEALLKFGSVEISWVPFSVSQPSSQNPPAASTCRPHTDAASPVLVNYPAPSPKSFYELLCPPSSSSSSSTVTLTTSSQSKTSGINSPAPVSCPSTSWKSVSSLRVVRSGAPLALTPAATPTPPVLHVKKTKQVLPASTSVNLQLFSFPPSAGPSTVLKLFQPPLVLNHPNQKQPSAVLLTGDQTVYQVSGFALPSVVPALPMPLIQTSSLLSDQQKMGTVTPVQFSPASVSPQILTKVTTGNRTSEGPPPPLKDCHKAPPDHKQSVHQPQTELCSPTTSRPPSFDQPPTPDISTHSSSLEHSQQSPVVMAVADSACDRSVQQVVARWQEPAENEPTSTVSEEPAPEVSDREPKVLDQEPEVLDREPEESEVLDREPKEPEVLDQEPEVLDREPEESEVLDREPKEPEVLDQEPEVLDREPKESEVLDREPEESEILDREPEESEVLDREPEERSYLIGYMDCSLSQWQPTVRLFRLPVPLPRPGCPLPSFRLVAGDVKGEIYLEELSTDTESHDDDITQPSSPESPVTLLMVRCSVCRSANGSIVCTACGRGFHHHCHVPPVGPATWSDWVCSLCQDLSDPCDPFSSDRPQRPENAGLSLLDQRRCESLLLYLKVKACSRLSEPHLDELCERLIGRSASYQTAADFLSDVWSLFKDSQDDEVLHRQRKRVRRRWMNILKSSYGGNTSAVTHTLTANMAAGREVAEGSAGSKVTSQELEVKDMRKRLKDFLLDTFQSKRMKMDTTET